MKTAQRTLWSLKTPSDGLYTNRALLALFFPILFEQALYCIVGFADTILASHLNDMATAGVSHAITVDSMVNAFLSGLAAGASVLTAQCYGARDLPRANASARMTLILMLALSSLYAFVALCFPRAIVQLFVGELDDETMAYTIRYYTWSLIGCPWGAVVTTCAAVLRAEGKTRLALLVSAVKLAATLALKYLFVLFTDLGVAGYSLSNMIVCAATGIWLLIIFCSDRLPVSLRRKSRPFWDFPLLRHCVTLGVPTAVENSLFQLGLVLVQRFVVTYGTVESAAHGIAKQLQPISYLPGLGWGLTSLVVTGRCIGANRKDLARFYAMHTLKLGYLSILILNIPVFLLLGSILRLYGNTPEVLALAKRLMQIYCIGAVPFYAGAYTLPQALRGGGDARAVMLISLGTMFLLRIGLAYILGTLLHLGASGVWIAMVADWAARTLIFALRYRSGKWLHTYS